MTRVRRVTAVLVTLAAAALATTAQGEAHGATPTERAAGGVAQPAQTKLHLHVTGCDTCTISLQHAVNGQLKVWTSPEKRIGSDHHATFRVRSSRTEGMSFVVRAPWQGNTGVVSNMVTRYRGQKIDHGVSVTTARQSTHAEGCWAGTSIDDVRLDFNVARVRAKTLDGKPTHIPLAYATHTMSSWKPMVKAYRGTIGNQDAFYCTRPPTTKLTFTASGCEGCDVSLVNGADRIENTWQSPDRKIKNGQVHFAVPRPLTRGITGVVTGPWEGATGYLTMIAFRYAGQSTGDAIGFHQARSKSSGSPCWAGTHDASTSIALTVRKVAVPGTTGPAAGSIAYADVTQPWLKPMLPARKGVLGTQSVITCHR